MQRLSTPHAAHESSKYFEIIIGFEAKVWSSSSSFYFVVKSKSFYQVKYGCSYFFTRQVLIFKEMVNINKKRKKWSISSLSLFLSTFASFGLILFSTKKNFGHHDSASLL